MMSRRLPRDRRTWPALGLARLARPSGREVDDKGWQAARAGARPSARSSRLHRARRYIKTRPAVAQQEVINV